MIARVPKLQIQVLVQVPWFDVVEQSQDWCSHRQFVGDADLAGLLVTPHLDSLPPLHRTKCCSLSSEFAWQVELRGRWWLVGLETAARKAEEGSELSATEFWGKRAVSHQILGKPASATEFFDIGMKDTADTGGDGRAAMLHKFLS